MIREQTIPMVRAVIREQTIPMVRAMIRDRTVPVVRAADRPLMMWYRAARIRAARAKLPIQGMPFRFFRGSCL